MAVIGKLHVGSTGRIRGPIDIEYNNPWPCVNGSWGSGTMRGVVMHTEVGNEPGTIAVFNNPNSKASAHFSIGQDGKVHQYGPIGKGWIAWHAFAANAAFYGIEHADNANPNNPLTHEQLVASAQLVEFLSGFAGFPLRVCDDCNGRGYAYHSMCASWNLSNHSCPDMPPKHVRSSQRAEVIRIATHIRNGTDAFPATPPPAEIHYTATGDGVLSLADIGKKFGVRISTILKYTLIQTTPVAFSPVMSDYLQTGDLTKPFPKGEVVRLRKRK